MLCARLPLQLGRALVKAASCLAAQFAYMAYDAGEPGCLAVLHDPESVANGRGPLEG